MEKQSENLNIMHSFLKKMLMRGKKIEQIESIFIYTHTYIQRERENL